MSTARVLTVPELLAIVLDFVVEDGYDHGIRSACYVARSWRDIAEERLWAHVDLPIVLRQLPLDAWYIYDDEDQSAADVNCHQIKGSNFESPTLTLRRGITQAEWAAVLPKTGRVRTIKTVGGPSDPEELLSKWGGLALAPAVYDMLAASMPNLCLFPRLHSLRIPVFEDQPSVLRLFASPGLRSVYFDERLDADFAAPYIAAFIDPATGVCPLQEMTLNHEYGSSEVDLAVLAVSLSACTALRRLTIECLDPELWPSIALLPSLEELNMRWARQVNFSADPDMETGDLYDSEDFEGEDPYDDAEDLPSRDEIQGIAFPALKSLVFPSANNPSLTFTQLRTILEMREEPWALKKFILPKHSLYLHLKYSVRTVLRYIKRHIRADTLTHLVVSTMWEWRYGKHNALTAVSQLFGFSNLTVLHLRCFYYDTHAEFEPLDADQTREMARSFPRLRILFLAMPFLPYEIGIFGQYCKDLRELTLNVQFCFDDRDKDMSELAEQTVPPAHQGIALERLVIGTYLLRGGDQEDLFDYAQSVYPNATIREVEDEFKL